MAHLLLRLDTNASARLRHLEPFVLQPEAAVTLDLPTGTFSGPVERCRGLRLAAMPETIEIACCVRCVRESIVVIRCSIVAESCRAARRSWGDGMCGDFSGGDEGAGPSSIDSGFAEGAW